MKTKVWLRQIVPVCRRLILAATLSALMNDAAAVEPGAYVGAGVGPSEHDLSAGSATGTLVILDRFGVRAIPRDSLHVDGDDTGWRGVIGYRLGRYLAAELEYLDFGGGRLRETFVWTDFLLGEQTAEHTYTTDVSGPAVSALGMLPIGDKFDLYLRAGVLFGDTKVTTHEFQKTDTYGDEVLLGGAGADWRLSDRWSARLEYQRSAELDANFDIAESRVELFSLSILYRLRSVSSVD